MTASPAPTPKLVGLEELLAHRQEARARGLRVVQCHGCFDIVHPGHIRHLRQAKAMGEVLLVSITADVPMEQGKRRPLIPQELRAENLAALDFVDWVYVEPSPDAAALLAEVRPDVYVKGQEYETNQDPRFAAERAAVEAHGGRVVFSSGDVVFSSTALIAALQETQDPFHARLARLAAEESLGLPALGDLITSFKDARVLVVGETILDTYVMCDRPEVAGESPVMTLRPLQERSYDGGAAIIARHAAAMGARPVLVTALPDTPQARAMRDRLEAQGVEVHAIAIDQPLPEKRRFLVGTQKVMKLDLVEPFVLDAQARRGLVDLAVAVAGGGVDAGIVADFGLGLFSPQVMPHLCWALRPLAKFLAGDVSGRASNLVSMRAMDLICPSESEARSATQLHGEGLPLVAWRLLEQTRCAAALVTLGADGLIAFDRIDVAAPSSHWTTRLKSEHVPALSPVAVDALGCGDALLAATSLARCRGASPLASAFLGACAAAVQVQRLGNSPVTADDLRRMIAGLHAGPLAKASDFARRNDQAAARAAG